MKLTKYCEWAAVTGKHEFLSGPTPSAQATWLVCRFCAQEGPASDWRNTLRAENTAGTTSLFVGKEAVVSLDSVTWSSNGPSG